MSIPPKKNVLNEKKVPPRSSNHICTALKKELKHKRPTINKHHDDDRDFVCGDSFESWGSVMRLR